MAGKIIHNRIKCKNCGDIIESVSVHDFVTCSCFKNEEGNEGIFCDGGKNYLRWGGKLENIEDMVEAEFEVGKDNKIYKARRNGKSVTVYDGDHEVWSGEIGEALENAGFVGVE